MMNMQGLQLIMHFEKLRLTPYLCSAKKPTIGWGTRYYPDGRAVTLKDSAITEEQATRFLVHHVGLIEAQMQKLVTRPISSNQWSALVCFVYNVGINGLATSTLLRLLNAGKPDLAAQEFARWNKETDPVTGAKRVVAGLTRRREAERRLFLTPDNNEDTV